MDFLPFVIIVIVINQTSSLQRTPIADFLPLLNPERLENEEVYQKVLDRLLNKSNSKPYDGRIRPNATALNTPTIIETSIYIRDISAVDEINFEFSVDMDLYQSWEDKRLAFGGKTLAAGKNATFLVARGTLVDQIWVPDVYFPNEKEGKYHTLTKKNQQMRIYSNGTVIYVIRLQITFSCMMNLQKYPMDTQTCTIQMSSYSYTTKDVQFRWAEPEERAILVNLGKLNLPKYTFRNSYARGCQISGISLDGTYTCLEAYMRLRREYGFHVIQTYVPTILLVIASWMSFWIDHRAVPARISIGVTTLLTIITMTTAVRLGLPPVSYVKGIDVWMFVCIFYIFAALIEFAIMNHAHQKFERDESVIPAVFRMCRKKPRRKNKVSVLYKDNDKVFRTETSSTITITSGESEKPIRPSRGGNKEKQKSKTPLYMMIDQIARYAFPCTFILFLILYFSIYTAGGPDETQ